MFLYFLRGLCLEPGSVRRDLIEHFLFPTHCSQALAFGKWLMDYSGSASVVASIRPCAKCMYKLHQSPSAIRADL